VSRVLLVFLDGVGIGEDDPTANPFLNARLPTLTEALGGRLPTLEHPRVEGPRGHTFPMDALMGVPGLPQSGTGQIAILTGHNAPGLMGRHFGPWPPVRLRPLLRDENLLRSAVTAGATVIFANAYPRGYPTGLSTRRVAAPPLAALGAGLELRDQEDLAAGRAIASEIVNDAWREHLGFRRLPLITEREAGATLASLATQAHLTLFAHYRTDLEGHRGGMRGAVEALERVDRFLAGIFGTLGQDTLLLLVSDHGNIEDVRVGHTRNPALGALFGGSVPGTADPGDLSDIAPFVLRAIEAAIP